MLYYLKQKRFTITLIFVISFLNHSCDTKKPNIIDDRLSYIDLDSLSKRDIIAENIHNCQFVKLQTTDDCLIKWITKIEFDEDKIFVRDANNKIFVFDEKGSFLNTIGRIGAGPDEQFTIFDFTLDKQSKKVLILDIHKSTLFSYAYSGDLIKKERFSETLFSNTSFINLADDNNLLLVLTNDHASPFNYGILSMENKNRREYLPYPATGNQTLSYGISKVGKAKENLYMCAFMSDTIYRYDTNSKEILPKWVFKGKLTPATPKDLDEQTYELALEALAVARDKHLSTGIDGLYATDHYIHFTYSINNNYYRVFFHTASQSGCYYKIMPADLLPSLNNLIATTDEAFVCFIPAYELLSENLEKYSNLREIANTTLEDDNPILVFHYLN